MSLAHKAFIAILTLILAFTLYVLLTRGYSYYQTTIEERFFHPGHESLKPSGITGHGLGIFGSLAMLLGVGLYMVRKRSRPMARLGLLKYWLEFHIFLCTLGPMLVLFHTAFKFGGLVAVSFWSMVAVFLSGIIGRFIYLQIPRTIEGRELSLSEVRSLKTNIGDFLGGFHQLDHDSHQTIMELTKKRDVLYDGNAFARYLRKSAEDRHNLSQVRKVLRKNQISRKDYRKIITLVRSEISLNRKIDRLVTMQNLFRHWHVAHLPFALVMLIIMIIHVIITITFGYRWIF